MKAALITYSRAKNYGGMLQAYALYKYLEDAGHDVEFIDYILPRSNIYDPNKFTELQTRKSRLWGKNKLMQMIWRMTKFPKIKKDYLKFAEFIEKRAKFTQKYFTYEELVSDPPHADIYITGSDQIWNPQFTEDQKPELPFFLGFAKGKKISYASSFGVTDISTESKQIIVPYLQEYAYISVREKSGQELLQELGIASEVVLDPTMLCDKKMWMDLCDKRMIQGKYAILYQVIFDKRIYDLAQQLCQSRGLKLYVVTMNRRDAHVGVGNVIMTPSIQEWLSYIRYSDLVVTESFHATVFSILFKREFIVNSATRKGMSTRISNLLNILDISDRELTSFEECAADEILRKSVDWEAVESKLVSEQKKSRRWLDNAMNTSKGEGKC